MFDPETSPVFPVTVIAAVLLEATAATVTWVVPYGAENSLVPSAAIVKSESLTFTEASVLSLDSVPTTTYTMWSKVVPSSASTLTVTVFEPETRFVLPEIERVA